MKRILIAAVLSCITQISFTQSFKQEYAQKLSNQFNYVEAFPVWVELVNESIELNKLDVASLRSCIAAAYGSEQYVEALKWSEMLLAKSKETVEADVLLHLQILLLNKKYDGIKQQLTISAPLFPTSVALQRWKSDVDKLPTILERKSQYDVKLFRSVDIGEEFSAVPFEEGVLLVTTGQNSGFVNRIYGKTGQFFTDLVYVKLVGGKQTKEVIWKDIKRTNPHDGPISFSSNNRFAFITTNQDALDEKNRIKYDRLELEIFEKERDEWIKRDFFKWNSNTYSTGHGTVDDTLNLYFVSDMPGGFGGTDIYVCKWNGNGYDAPKNLGPGVNSSGNELFPYVSMDGTLYFASNGWLGYGGLDVFTWDFVSNGPENMGSPVNSNADDFSFNVNEIAGKGFVSSNRTNWKDEVFVVNAKMQKRYVDIELKDCQNKPFAQQKVTLYKNDGSYFKTLISDDYGRMSYIGVIGEQYHLSFKDPITRLTDSVTFTNELDALQTIRLFARPKNQKSTLTVFNASRIPLDGALVRLYQNGKEIKKQVTKKDGKVLFDGQTVDSFSITAINYKEYLMKMPEDKKCDTLISLECTMGLNTGNAFINLDQVLYDYNKWDLRAESIIELDKLVKYMKSNDLKVELSSHTDSRGEDVYNEWLSQQRSNSCVNYIISKGISPMRIIAKGYGEYRLKNRCANDVECSDAEHQQNRRTELRIISE
jgi:outer membrane protein OmpA-like peptidoglycan-associated protein